MDRSDSAIMNTLSLSITFPILGYLGKQGHNLETILGVVGLDSSIFSTPEKRISHQNLTRLINHAVHISRDPHLGIHAGEAANITSMGLLGQLMMNVDNLQECLESYMRYQDFLCDSLQFVVNKDDSFSVIYQPADWKEQNFVLLESLFMTILTILNLLTARQIKPDYVGFNLPAPAETEEHSRAFKVAPKFSAEKNEMRFPKEILAYTVISRNPEIGRILEEEIKRKNAMESTDSTLARKLVNQWMKKLPLEIPSVEEVALSLHMSKRNLQKKLNQEGSSYRAIVEDLRLTFANRFLDLGTYSIGEIAYLLDFSEESSFIRFYRRMTGDTPGKRQSSRG